MEIRRILKVLVARWLLVVLAAVVGGVVGIVLARNHNDGIRPQWRAQAPVTFIQLDDGVESGSSGGRASGGQNSGGTSTAATVDVGSERARALLLLEETLQANPRLSIESERVENLLLFVAVGRDGEETLEAALSLRDEYQALGATVLSVDQIKVTMGTLLTDIDELGRQIADLQVPEPEAEDTAVVAQREVLESEIGTLEQRQAQLGVWIGNPELRPPEDEFVGVDTEAGRSSGQPAADEEVTEPVIVTVEVLEAERLSNAVVLRRLQVELARLPDPPQSEELGGEAILELEALNLDIAELEAQYIDLLRRLDGRPPGGFFEEPAVSDETPSARSTALFGLVGLLAGGLVVSAAAVALDGARRPVWTVADLEGIVSLGVVNRDRTDGPLDSVWYPASLSQRRRDIQTLRAATDAVTEEQPAIIGFFGVGVASYEVGEVAADLAAAYTVAERNVLLIDGNAFNPNTLPEFGSGTGELNDTLTTQMPGDDATRALNRLLDDTPSVIPCLTALGIDAEAHDPIDVFASPNCRLLMDVAKSRYDIVVLAGPDVAEPLSDAVVRRVDYVVLVGYVGYTKISQLATAAEVLADRRANLAGVVLLEGRRQPALRRVSELANGLVRRVREASSRTDSRSVAAAAAESSDIAAPLGGDSAPSVAGAAAAGGDAVADADTVGGGTDEEKTAAPGPGMEPDAVPTGRVSRGKGHSG